MRRCWRTTLACLFLLATAAQASVTVAPHASTLLPGKTCAFKVSTNLRPSPPAEGWVWTILDGGPGLINAVTGAYTAQDVDQPCLVKVRATHPLAPGHAGQAVVLILPFEPFDLVGKVLGPDWVAPFSSAMPFHVPGTERRLVEGQYVLPVTLGRTPALSVGFGIPFELNWLPVGSAEAMLLSFQVADDLVQMDVTGKTSQVVTAKGRVTGCRVEGLSKAPGPLDTVWQSVNQQIPIHVRGMVRFAGNDLTGPGHGDGKGLAAVFREPFGLALISEEDVEEEETIGSRAAGLLVTDPKSHVIRLVSATGEVSTPWGQPDRPGHGDPPSSFLRRWTDWLGLTEARRESLFHGPTFLEMRTSVGPTWRCLVADSGNQVIRELQGDGTVTTLAGVPGQAGHRDAARADAALFHDPQGLVEDDDEMVYVADRGNHVIRSIAPDGQVRTLAGSPGETGSLDGTGAGARFTALRGMAFCRWPLDHPSLYVVDGHAIRRIALPGGEVTTLLGVVDTPGFQDILSGSNEARSEALRQPCLKHPCGLLVTSFGALQIADEGNNCVRLWAFDLGLLATLVGAPGQKETRWGLLRDGMDVPTDDRYAALDGPKTLVRGPGPGLHVVTTGSCLAELLPNPDLEETTFSMELAAAQALCAEACHIAFSLEVQTFDNEEVHRPMQYTVDFLEADGSLGERHRGEGTTGTPLSVQGHFGQRGTGTVVVRCVTDQGRSAGAKRQVEVV